MPWSPGAEVGDKARSEIVGDATPSVQDTMPPYHSSRPAVPLSSPAPSHDWAMLMQRFAALKR